MNWFFNLWANSYRKGRAISAALVMWALVAGGAILKCQSNADPFLGCHTEAALVISLEDPVGFKGEPVEKGFVWGQVMLDDSTSVRIQFIDPLPAVGQKVPLVVEDYQSGKHNYFLDKQSWTTMGSPL